MELIDLRCRRTEGRRSCGALRPHTRIPTEPLEASTSDLEARKAYLGGGPGNPVELLGQCGLDALRADELIQ